MGICIDCDDVDAWINTYSLPAVVFSEESAIFACNQAYLNDALARENFQRILEQCKDRDKEKQNSVYSLDENHRYHCLVHNIQLNQQSALLFIFTPIELSNPLIFQSEELKILSHSDIGAWAFNIVTQEGFFSEKFKQLIGYSQKEELTWETFRSQIYQDDMEIFDVFFNAHTEFDIKLKFDFRLAQQDPTADVQWFLIQGELQEDSQIITGILRETSVEKEAFTALTQAGRTNDLALQAGNIGVWSGEKDRNGVWQWTWDSRIVEMFEFSEEDIGDLQAWKNKIMASDRQMVLQLFDDALQSGLDYQAQYRLCLKNGDIRYVKDMGKVTRNPIGDIHRIDGIRYDQTQLRLAHQELKQMNETLERRVAERTVELEKARIAAENASEAKGRFLAMMSHELRTPMNAVIGSLDLLQTYEQSFEEMDLIETAKTSAVGLVNILNDILDFSKIEAGKLNLIIEDISIYKLVDEVISIIIPVASEKNIQLSVKETPSLPALVQSDEVRVKQILFNLLGNALKFTSNSENSSGKVRLEVSVLDSNEYTITIEFKIIDNGIGIEPEIQKKLFTPFTQAEKSNSRKYGGTGIGLTISGQLAEMLGGNILFDSTPGEGSTFSFQFTPWLSKPGEQNRVPDLFGNTIGLLDLSSNEQTESANWQQTLTNEGAEVEELSLDVKASAAEFYDVVLIFSDDVSVDIDRIREFVTRISCVVIVASYKSGNGWDKLADLNILRLVLSSCTRCKFVRKVKRALDISELEAMAEGDVSAPQKTGNSEVPETQTDAGDILIVEDNLLNQKLIRKQLAKLGWQCKIVSDGLLGYAEWLTSSYRLILTDCHMPNMDGYEMTRKIRLKEGQNGAHSRIPIVAITGAAMKGDEELCFDAGMDDFLSKPIQLNDIKRVLETWYG